MRKSVENGQHAESKVAYVEWIEVQPFAENRMRHFDLVEKRFELDDGAEALHLLRTVT